MSCGVVVGVFSWRDEWCATPPIKIQSRRVMACAQHSLLIRRKRNIPKCIIMIIHMMMSTTCCSPLLSILGKSGNNLIPPHKRCSQHR